VSTILAYPECTEYVLNIQDLMEEPGIVGARETHAVGEADLFYSQRGWCVFCKQAARNVYEKREADSLEAGTGEAAFLLENEWRVWQCDSCGWWDLLYDGKRSHEIEGTHVRKVIRSAVLKVFDVKSSELPVEILRKVLTRRPNLLNEIQPRKMEELARSVFSDFYDCEVVHCGGPNDEGFDLVVILSDHPIVIQVKRRENAAKAESVSTVVHLVGAMMFQDRRRGMVVTTSGRYSKAAKRKAELAVTKNLVDSLELVDANRLLEILNLYSTEPSDHWKKHLPTHK
jgi:restriction system protein